MTEAIATEAAVHRALDEIDQRGEKPTQRRVIELLGGGSFSTVTRHCQTWRPKDRPAANLGPVPETVAVQAGQLIDHLWTLSGVEAEKRANDRVAEIETRLQRSETDREELAVLLDQVTSERDTLKDAAADRDEWKARWASVSAERDALDRIVAHLSGQQKNKPRQKAKRSEPSEETSTPSA